MKTDVSLRIYPPPMPKRVSLQTVTHVTLLINVSTNNKRNIEASFIERSPLYLINSLTSIEAGESKRCVAQFILREYNHGYTTNKRQSSASVLVLQPFQPLEF